jgi:hypothetical protein
VPALDESPSSSTRRRPSGISVGEAALLDKMDDLVAEMRLMREKVPSQKVLLGAVMFVFVMMFASQVYMVSLLAESRGVDTGAAASATKVVLDATPRPEGTVTTTTTETVSPSPEPERARPEPSAAE